MDDDYRRPNECRRVGSPAQTSSTRYSSKPSTSSEATTPAPTAADSTRTTPPSSPQLPRSSGASLCCSVTSCSRTVAGQPVPGVSTATVGCPQFDQTVVTAYCCRVAGAVGPPTLPTARPGSGLLDPCGWETTDENPDLSSEPNPLSSAERHCSNPLLSIVLFPDPKFASDS